jgi:hypothetical protein
MTAMDHLTLFYAIGLVMSLGLIAWLLWQKHHR